MEATTPTTTAPHTAASPTVLTAVVEYLLMCNNGGMTVLPFCAWLRMCTVSRTIYARFRRGAVPAFLRYLRRAIIKLIGWSSSLELSRCVLGGSFITSLASGYGRRNAYGRWAEFLLNVYTPIDANSRALRTMRGLRSDRDVLEEYQLGTMKGGSATVYVMGSERPAEGDAANDGDATRVAAVEAIYVRACTYNLWVCTLGHGEHDGRLCLTVPMAYMYM